MRLIKQIDGVVQVQRDIHHDSRGHFSEVVPAGLDDLLGVKFIQTNVSFNQHRYTFRGLHTQTGEHAQGKLVTVLSYGTVRVFVVDIRKESPTYLTTNVFGLEYDKSVYVPEGCLHGFLTTVDNTYFHYAVTKPYSKEHEIVINYASPEFGIDLNSMCSLMNLGECTQISNKDKNAQTWSEYNKL